LQWLGTVTVRVTSVPILNGLIPINNTYFLNDIFLKRVKREEEEEERRRRRRRSSLIIACERTT